MIELKKILLPSDFSEPSLIATRYGLELARQFGSTLHLMHAIEVPMAYSSVFGGYAPDHEQIEQFVQTELDNWISDEDADGLTIERHWTHGRAFVTILRYAKEHDIDLIVMGTHGRGFTAHLLMGSVAEKVVRKAPCPVLTIRPEDYRYVPFDQDT